MKLMRKRNPELQEEGFHQLLPHASAFVDELLIEFAAETDHGLKCWLLELLGEARDERVLDVFAQYLNAEDESLSHWAEVGLRALDTKQARHLLYEHNEHLPKFG